MKNINRKANIIFIIILLIFVCIGGIWYFLSDREYSKYQLYTQDSVSGLIVDSPVEFHGVEIGRVNRIDLLNPQLVKIIVRIKKAAPITRATVATITGRGLASRGFTGYVYIALENINNDDRKIEITSGSDYPTIATNPSTSESLDTTFSQLNKNVQSITNLFQSILDKHTIASLQQLVNNLQQISKTLAENNHQLASIINNTEKASHQFSPLLQSGTNSFNALQTQILPEAYNVFSDLDKLSNSFENAATKINRDPSVLIRGIVPPKLGPGEK